MNVNSGKTEKGTNALNNALNEPFIAKPIINASSSVPVSRQGCSIFSLPY
jgi:hypothetical protein